MIPLVKHSGFVVRTPLRQKAPADRYYNSTVRFFILKPSFIVHLDDSRITPHFPALWLLVHIVQVSVKHSAEEKITVLANYDEQHINKKMYRVLLYAENESLNESKKNQKVTVTCFIVP